MSDKFKGIKNISDIKMNGEDFEKGDKVFLFGIVTRLEEKLTRDDKKYCEFILDDKSGEIMVKIWETDLESLNVKNSMLVKIGAEVGEWDNKPQLKILSKSNSLMLREVVKADKVQIMDYVKTAPIPGQEMYDDVVKIISKFTHSELKKVCTFVLKEYKEKLLYFPGSKTVHHACYAGLLYHIHSMFLTSKGMAHYDINLELLQTGILIHDIGKFEELDVSKIGVASDYTKTGSLLGHIVDGIRIMDRIFITLSISEEISTLLLHMIASHHHDEKFGAYQMPKFMEAQLLHHLDSVDSRINMIDNSLTNVEEGEFGARAFFLNNREMYKPDMTVKNPNLKVVDEENQKEAV